MTIKFVRNLPLCNELIGYFCETLYVPGIENDSSRASEIAWSGKRRGRREAKRQVHELHVTKH